MGETPMPPQNGLPFWVKARRWKIWVRLPDSILLLKIEKEGKGD